jgi:hypothetical protein
MVHFLHPGTGSRVNRQNTRTTASLANLTRCGSPPTIILQVGLEIFVVRRETYAWGSMC